MVLVSTMKTKATASSERWSRWAALDHSAHVAILEKVLTGAGVSVPPAKAGESVAQRARALYTLAENKGLEQTAESMAPAPAAAAAEVPATKSGERDLWAEYDAISDPGERFKFYNANRDAFLALARR